MQAWHHLSAAFQPTVSLLLIVWNCDTGALVAGRLSTSLLQRRIPVAEAIQRVSPKKSMEGMMGGLLLGSLTTIFMPWWWRYLDSMGLLVFEQDIWNRHTIPWGLVLSSCAILGDLAESAVKRVSKSKDSSRLLPGHGGILDRFDSSFVAVIVYRLFVMPT
jgi:phosphatidate cytidylyltransferase